MSTFHNVWPADGCGPTVQCNDCGGIFYSLDRMAAHHCPLATGGVDLTRTDEYPGPVPDKDVEVCLRVIRTVRNVYLRPQSFNAGAALVLSSAHAQIHEAVKQCQEGSDDAGAGPGSADQPAVVVDAKEQTDA